MRGVTLHAFRRAKIVSTIGPASTDPEVFEALVRAGTDAVRINFSHATHEGAAEIFRLAREVGERLERPLAVIADLQGPKIRVGDLPEALEIREGDSYCLIPEERQEGATAEEMGVAALIPITYADLAGDLALADRVLLNDGRIELRVVEIRGDRVKAEAVTSGELISQKGINLPGVAVRAPSLTRKDLADLRFALEQGADFIALSFVRRPEDITELRSEIGRRSLIISKIEKDQALDDLGQIIARSDGVMVARGDLGVELPYEDVPLVQKRIIHHGHELARPTITATQMLESMTEANIPTRAEVSDVATSLLDGTDAVMLSAETTIGRHPIDAVRAMSRIIGRIEAEGPPFPSWVDERPEEERSEIQQTTSGAIAAAALQAVKRLSSPFLVTFTRSGFTARVVSAQRPPVPILAVTDQPRTYRQLAVVWGIHPVLLEDEVNYRSMLARSRREALEEEFGEPGDHFIVTAGVPFHVTGTTNMIRIEQL